MHRFHAILAAEDDRLTAHLRRIVGDRDTDDLRQETYVRAWRSAPRDLPEPALRAWLHRTAHNAAIDELRRRRRQPELGWDEESAPAAARGVTDDAAADGDAHEALAALTAHQRLVLLLRFESGLSLRELGEILDVGEDAARKRVARARTAFAAALKATRHGDTRPLVALVQGRDDVEPYRHWLTDAGGRVVVLRPDRPLHLAGADALVLMGSERDLHPRLYGAVRDAHTVDPHLTGDLRDLAALRLALASDLPVVGVCRGAQLLNVLFGGDLDQHVAGHDHRRSHPVDTAPGSAARRALGPRPAVHSDHHQAVGRLGAGLRVTATAPDGHIEALELPGRRMVLGTQWHPEREPDGRLAEALVAAAGTASA